MVLYSNLTCNIFVLFCILGIHSKANFARLDARKFLAQYSSFWEFFRFNSEKERLELASQKAEQEVLFLSHLQKLRVDTKYFKQLLSHGINSVEQFQENLDSVVLQKIFEYDDLRKLQDAPLRKDDQFADSFPYRSAITIFSFSWWTFTFACELNNI